MNVLHASGLVSGGVVPLIIAGDGVQPACGIGALPFVTKQVKAFAVGGRVCT